ncbi:MAG: mechanosensitive ion channel family protein [Gemmatimonadaceae bacterium]|nr:mechanosensitive ion channel family protein [Gemmatimonadaceae bacterium]
MHVSDLNRDLPPRETRWLRTVRQTSSAVLMLGLSAASAGAQFLKPSASRTAADSAAEPVSSASPRVALQEFERLAKANDWSDAATYLALPKGSVADGPLLARHLKVVLDQKLALNVEQLSPLAVGDTSDGDRNGDKIAVILRADGREDPVRMVRTTVDGRMRWVFAPQTVELINTWYENLGAPWLRDRLPPSLMREGFLRVFYWQWIGLALLLPAIVLIAWLVGGSLRFVLTRLASRTATEWDNLLVDHLRGPFRLWISALVAPPLLALLELNARLSALVQSATRGVVLLALFWGLLRVIRLGQKRLESQAWEAGQGAQARTLVPLLGNFLRITLAIIALLVALAQFGYPVGTLLAGLGIGGIAVALAAQKTVEHLFGSVSLAADRAFRVGDWVRAGTTEGTVERIGLRSTSFRTNERTVVRIPNGRLADERIETFGERDRILLRTDIDLTYGTPAATIQAIRDDLEAALRAHPLIWTEALRVHVVAFTESAIRINVLAWFQTQDWAEFLLIRHQMLLEFMAVVERNHSSFAFPSRTVYHVTQDENTPPSGPRGGSAAVD